MIRYEAPKMEITYFVGAIGTTDAVTLSDPTTYTNAALNMNNAAFDETINAAAARTVKVQTILKFN